MADELAQAALAQAAAEGLELVRAPTSASGYKGVSYAPHSKSIQVIAYFKGKMVTIAKAGVYQTPEEGALAYARWLKRTPGAAAFRQGCHNMDDKKATLAGNDKHLRVEALRQASQEGLEFLRSEQSQSGLLGVYCQSGSLPHYAFHARQSFRTAEEAALAEARWFRDHPSVKPKRPELRAPKSKPEAIPSSQALLLAKHEQLELEPSKAGTSGFKGVTYDRNKGRYVAFCADGFRVTGFQSAEDAALALARHLRDHPEAALEAASTGSRGAKKRKLSTGDLESTPLVEPLHVESISDAEATRMCAEDECVMVEAEVVEEPQQGLLYF